MPADPPPPRWLLPLAAALFVGLYATLSWPLLLRSSTDVLGVGHMDQLGHLWATWNVAESLAFARHSPYNFYPYGQNLLVVHGGHLDLLLGAALVWLGLPLTMAHDLVLVGFLVMGGVMGTLLGFRLTGSVPAALAAGLALPFQPWVHRNAAQGLVEETGLGFVALTFYGALACLDRPGWRGPATLAAGVVLTTLTSWEYGVFLAGGMLLFGVASLREERAPGAFGRLVVGCLGASVALLPLVALFLADMAHARTELAESLPGAAVAVATRELRAAQSLGPDALFFASGRGPAFVHVAAALALLGLFQRPWRRQGVLLAWFVGFSLLSFGPALRLGGEAVTLLGRPIPLPFAAVQALFPFLDWLYWPERFLGVAAVGLAGLVGLGVQRLVCGWGRSRAVLAVGALFVADSLLSVQHAFPRFPTSYLPEPRGVYRCLEGGPPGALLEAPFPSFGVPTLLGHPQTPAELALSLRLNEAAHAYRWNQTFHERPLVAGVDVPHAVPAAWRAMAMEEPTLRMFALAGAGISPTSPPADAKDSLRRLGVAAVLVHDQLFPHRRVVPEVIVWMKAAFGEPTCQDHGPRAALWWVR